MWDQQTKFNTLMVRGRDDVFPSRSRDFPERQARALTLNEEHEPAEEKEEEEG